MQNKLKKISIALISLLLLASALLLEVFPPHAFYNQLLGRVNISGFQSNITLNDYHMRNQFKESISWQDFADKPLFITAGFTYCAYTCPVTLSIFKKLDDKLNNKANYALLTIDPANDKPDVLRTYLAGFGDNFTGIYIEDNKLFKKALSDLRKSIKKLAGENDIIHDDLIYLLHPKLDGLVIYADNDISAIVNDLKKLEDE
jgi:cytochrome oxidase Cu insertion factor (SCO1/SenC/PrrC family)